MKENAPESREAAAEMFTQLLRYADAHEDYLLGALVADAQAHFESSSSQTASDLH